MEPTEEHTPKALPPEAPSAKALPPEVPSAKAPPPEAQVQDGDNLSYEQLVEMYDDSMRHLNEGEIVSGTVIAITANDVVVDVGYKSEGLVPIHEFSSREDKLQVSVGDEVEVLLEQTEGADGHVMLSKVKAERMRIWAQVETSFKEGKVIKGRVIDRIKGGLTVDVGLRAFLPGSLVDIKPVKYLESFKGEELEFKVISLDRRRNNIVLSRRAVLEKEYAKKKAETLTKLKEGVRLPGVVKNITDYGVFVDLGGIDGLLHITDISWGRVNHPSEHFGVGDEVEVVVLRFDPETERVSLGYKQTTEDPWTLVDKKYPLGSRVRGRVVSLVDYGAFVELEEGVEGLVHVSEMSWTKKVVPPSKIVSVGQEVDAIVSELDMSQRRISLSLRQVESNPWEDLAARFPVGTIVEGRVRNLTEFGAFVEITEEIDGLVHVSDMSWTKRVKHPSEVLARGDAVRARITNIDVTGQRVSLSIKDFLPNEWQDFVDGHSVGDDIVGRVVNVTDFGLFIDVYDGLEGLAHVSEVDVPGGKLEDHYRIGEFVRARILRIEDEDKKVGLTLRGVTELSDEEAEELSAERERKLAAARAAAEEAAAAAEAGEEEHAAAEAGEEEQAAKDAGEEDATGEIEASGMEEPPEAVPEDVAEVSADASEADEVAEASEAGEASQAGEADQVDEAEEAGEASQAAEASQVDEADEADEAEAEAAASESPSDEESEAR
ncbi:MAG: 30S ribosomal protein S1 [Holophagales bacterium]|nr:30S ribosomal protein S1 [Holophagales bacterium]